VFFLDCTGHVADPRLGEALQGLKRICADVRFLGSYQRHRWSAAAGERPVPAPAGLSDEDFADSTAWLARLRSGDPV
jgi:prephenate dehydratase